MGRRVPFVLLLLSELLLPPGRALWAQEARGEVFAPFVSRLKARSGDAGVVLTWQDSTDLKGCTRIYRHTAEITADNFDQAELIARLQPPNTGQAQQGSYTDFPPTQGTYYYAVLLEGPEGNLYKLFIPFRNKISSGVSVHRAFTEEQAATEITALAARIESDGIALSYRSSRSDREMLLFRSTEPVRTSDGLLAASPPLSLPAGTTRYTDFPVPGVDYYYTIIDAGLFRLGDARIQAGENTTVEPVRIPLEARSSGLPATALRPVPLPYLTIGSRMEPPPTSGPMASAAPLSTATRQAVSELLASAPGGALDALASSPGGANLGGALDALPSAPGGTPGLRPGEGAAPPGEAHPDVALPPAPEAQLSFQVLPADAGPDASTFNRREDAVRVEVGGDERALKAILAKHLIKGDFAGGEEALKRLLRIPRQADLEARARFYLAQTYYFRQMIREAILELLMVEDLYYREAQPWMDACLRLLAGPQTAGSNR
jgi:hypothetical protein